MAKKPTTVQIAYIADNCYTHTEDQLVIDTGLDLKTVVNLRNEAMAKQDSDMINGQMTLKEGVHAMTQGVSEQMDEIFKGIQKGPNRDHISKVFPDR